MIASIPPVDSLFAAFSPFLPPMLQAQGLFFSYSPSSSFQFPDLSLHPGDHTLLLGASGSGKTTWLHLLGGLREPTAGTIRYGEVDLVALKSGARDQFRGRHIGMVFQQPHLISALDVLGNVRLAAELTGHVWEVDRAMALLASLGIADKARQPIRRLSGGEAQRVALARALINRPSVLLADEPTASLDDGNCHRVVSLLLQTAEEVNATLIMATHDQRVKEHFSNTLALS